MAGGGWESDGGARAPARAQGNGGGYTCEVAALPHILEEGDIVCCIVPAA